MAQTILPGEDLEVYLKILNGTAISSSSGPNCKRSS